MPVTRDVSYLQIGLSYGDFATTYQTVYLAAGMYKLYELYEKEVVTFGKEGSGVLGEDNPVTWLVMELTLEWQSFTDEADADNEDWVACQAFIRSPYRNVFFTIPATGNTYGVDVQGLSTYINGHPDLLWWVLDEHTLTIDSLWHKNITLKLRLCKPMTITEANAL